MYITVYMLYTNLSYSYTSVSYIERHLPVSAYRDMYMLRRHLATITYCYVTTILMTITYHYCCGIGR